MISSALNTNYSTMKFAIALGVLCLVLAASAAPKPEEEDPQVAVMKELEEEMTRMMRTGNPAEKGWVVKKYALQMEYLKKALLKEFQRYMKNSW